LRPEQIGGLAAVSLFAVLLIAVTIHWCSIWRGANRTRWLAIAVTVLAMAGTSIHWLARPHLFTLLFAVIFLNALDRVRAGRRGWRAFRGWCCCQC